MITSLGLPSLYLMVNPTDAYNPIVKIINGDKIDIDNMCKNKIPDYLTQATQVAKNPFLAAKFFDMYMTNFVESLLGKGMEGSQGVYGKYKAHYGTVEAQGRGTLHCHLLLWIEGDLLTPKRLKTEY